MIYLSAFTAGLVSFFSPCILPILPAYLSWIGGQTAGELTETSRKGINRGLLISSSFFILGFSLVFSLMGAAASSLGNILVEYKTILLRVMGVLIFLMGLHTAQILKFRFMYYEKRLKVKRRGGYAGSFLIGLGFGLGWSPCIGPFLAGALVLAANSSRVWEGISILFVYSMGIALPLLLASLVTGEFIAWASRNRKILVYIERGAGIILCLLGIVLFFDKLMIII